jgi:hypothetical protein
MKLFSLSLTLEYEIWFSVIKNINIFSIYDICFHIFIVSNKFFF